MTRCFFSNKTSSERNTIGTSIPYERLEWNDQVLSSAQEQIDADKEYLYTDRKYFLSISPYAFLPSFGKTKLPRPSQSP